MKCEICHGTSFNKYVYYLKKQNTEKTFSYCLDCSNFGKRTSCDICKIELRRTNLKNHYNTKRHLKNVANTQMEVPLCIESH